MKKEGQIITKKRLLITNERLAELESLLSKYCAQVDWKATLIDGTTITFDSFEELQHYSNFGSSKILGIKADGHSDDYTTRIDVSISREYPILKRFGECNFKFASEDQFTVFKKETQTFFEKCVEGEVTYQAGKWGSAFVLIGLVLYTASKYIKVTAGDIFLIYLSSIMLAGALFWLLITVSAKIWDYIIPSITFAIGEGIARYEKSKKLRSNIFWGVIIAGIIGFLLNHLL